MHNTLQKEARFYLKNRALLNSYYLRVTFQELRIKFQLVIAIH